MDILFFTALVVMIQDAESSAICFSTINPCDTNNHKVWNDPTRNVNHPFISQAEDSELMEGWYRAIEPAGIDMSTNKLSPLACQSFSPIWLKGTVPNVGDGIVQRSACVQTVLDPNECAEILQTCVKNCGDFNIYFLLRPTGTHGRYCFASAVTTIPPDSSSHPSKTTLYATTTSQPATTTTTQSMSSTTTTLSTTDPMQNTIRTRRPTSQTDNDHNTVRTMTTDDTTMYLIIIGVLITTLVVGTMIVGCACYNKQKANHSNQTSSHKYLDHNMQSKPYFVSSLSAQYNDKDDMKNGMVFIGEDCKYDGSNVYENMAMERDDHNYQAISLFKNESAAIKKTDQDCFTADGDTDHSEIPANDVTV